MTLTLKQEAFARAYVETGNASEAYRQAYNAENMKPEAIKVEASRLLDNPNVALTVDSLKAKHQKAHDVTVASLTEALNRALKKAEGEAKGASAMVSAVMGLGKLHGLITEKREVKHVSGAEDLDDNELANLAVAGRRRTSSPSSGTPQPN